MRRTTRAVATAVLVGLVFACGSDDDVRAPRVAASSRQPFASAEATLVDFVFDGALVAPTNEPGSVERLIEGQLMFAVGQLNGRRSVGRHERLELSNIDAAPRAGGAFDVRYSAKLPVAWGEGPPPGAYELVLPVRVDVEGRERFARAYGAACTDPEGGDVDADRSGDVARLFLVYRPERAGCTFASGDVVRTQARVSPSPENTAGKLPEYERIWDDGILHVAAVFGREFDDGRAHDAGLGAHDDYLRKADIYLASLQPDSSRRSRVVRPDGSLRLETTLPDGRVVRLDTLLIGTRVSPEPTAFDAWYDAMTPDADMILYSGHAAHGANVRSLFGKGTFRPGKYMVLVVNGCDTFAYIDETLAVRRAALNPDDPAGTKYMDTVSNVLGGWFHTGDDTSLRFVRAAVDASGPRPDPKTYAEIFADIDRDQVIVVTGEEDNPSAGGPTTSPPSAGDERARAAPGTAPPSARSPRPARGESSSTGGCDATGAASGGASPAAAATAGVAVGALLRRRRRASASRARAR